MKGYFGYIRVSTQKQGEKGSSLQEQRSAIEAFAHRQKLPIQQWFEERETAAKRGRREFGKMFSLLRAGRADGLIIHKIDRSARNLRDWADLGELIDQGVVVHFANESLDLSSRGGRLSADIQAVVAADYIRNLKEEVRKGFVGRLKQGLYPLPAPMGYLDRGGGCAKEIDPLKGPLVRAGFELYASGAYPLHGLLSELRRRGLRSQRGGGLSLNGLAAMLRNPFYIGLVRIKRTGELYQGAHRPLISKELFTRVQAVLDGRLSPRPHRHQFLFRRMVRCHACGRSLCGERQKGHVYYRCQTRTCPTTCLREEAIEGEVVAVLNLLRFTPEEREQIDGEVAALKAEWSTRRVDELKGAELHLARLDDRLNKLTDAFLDSLIDRDAFERRKQVLLLDRCDAVETITRLKREGDALPAEVEKCLERANTALLGYGRAGGDAKRMALQSVISNLCARGKYVEVELRKPFEAVAKRAELAIGPPYRGDSRTLAATVIANLVRHFGEHREGL
jgi:site-specific DNA recombinase